MTDDELHRCVRRSIDLNDSEASEMLAWIDEAATALRTRTLVVRPGKDMTYVEIAYHRGYERGYEQALVDVARKVGAAGLEARITTAPRAPEGGALAQLARDLGEVNDQIEKLPGIDVAIKTLRYVQQALMTLQDAALKGNT